MRKDELYDILRLRFEVFVIEQNSIYEDIDGKDRNATHLFYTENGDIIAYSRVYEIEDYYKIGRVVVKKSRRGEQLGQMVFKKSMEYIKREDHSPTIKISAQDQLREFYKNFGFEVESEIYDDGGVPHVDMIRR